jgi:hypothetical protein
LNLSEKTRNKKKVIEKEKPEVQWHQINQPRMAQATITTTTIITTVEAARRAARKHRKNKSK